MKAERRDSVTTRDSLQVCQDTLLAQKTNLKSCIKSKQDIVRFLPSELCKNRSERWSAVAVEKPAIGAEVLDKVVTIKKTCDL